MKATTGIWILIQIILIVLYAVFSSAEISILSANKRKSETEEEEKASEQIKRSAGKIYHSDADSGNVLWIFKQRICVGTVCRSADRAASEE